MLKLTLAIAMFVLIPKANAQSTVPFPGYGPLYGNGTIQGGRDYNDWQATRRDHGLDYDRNAVPDPYEANRSPYRPYPTVEPPRRSRGYLDDED